MLGPCKFQYKYNLNSKLCNCTYCVVEVFRSKIPGLVLFKFKYINIISKMYLKFKERAVQYSLQVVY